MEWFKRGIKGAPFLSRSSRRSQFFISLAAITSSPSISKDKSAPYSIKSFTIDRLPLRAATKSGGSWRTDEKFDDEEDEDDEEDNEEDHKEEEEEGFNGTDNLARSFLEDSTNFLSRPTDLTLGWKGVEGAPLAKYFSQPILTLAPRSNRNLTQSSWSKRIL